MDSMTRELLVKSFCRIDNLTQDNSWKEILDYLRENIVNEDKVLLDFKGINVVDPWTLDSFGEILKMNNIFFRFTSCNKEQLDNFVNKIKMKCIIEGLLVDRIDAIYIEPIREKTKEELRIEKLASEFVGNFIIEEENNQAYVEMYKIYDQICSVATVEAVIGAIRMIKENKGIENFLIKTKKMFIQSNMLELLASYVIKLEDEGINLSIDTDKEEDAKNLGLLIHMALTESYDVPKRLKAFMTLTPNTPGLLVKYKSSRAVDQFGRNGKGQVVSNRISVYRGICKKESVSTFKLLPNIIAVGKYGVKLDNGDTVDFDDIRLVMDTYNNDKFMTRAEWITRNDGELVDENGNDIETLPFDRVLIGIDKIGLMDKFLGTNYHFLRPVQQTESESRTIIVDIDENSGSCISKKVTIPERIKLVLKDWGIQFDPVDLEQAIVDTDKILNP